MPFSIDDILKQARQDDLNVGKRRTPSKPVSKPKPKPKPKVTVPQRATPSRSARVQLTEAYRSQPKASLPSLSRPPKQPTRQSAPTLSQLQTSAKQRGIATNKNTLSKLYDMFTLGGKLSPKSTDKTKATTKALAFSPTRMLDYFQTGSDLIREKTGDKFTTRIPLKEDSAMSQFLAKNVPKGESPSLINTILFPKSIMAEDITKDYSQIVSEARGKSLEDLGKTGQFAGNLAYSAADMVGGIALSVVNPVLGASYMGSLVAGDTTSSALERGASKEKALVMGTLAGAFEAATEAIPLGMLADNIAKIGIKGLSKTGVKALAINMLKNAGVEAGQETITELANTISDILIMKDSSEFNLYKDNLIENGASEKEAQSATMAEFFAKRLGQSALGGALMGGLLGGGTSAIGNIGQSNIDQDLTDAHTTLDEAIANGDEAMQRNMIPIIEGLEQQSLEVAPQEQTLEQDLEDAKTTLAEAEANNDLEMFTNMTPIVEDLEQQVALQEPTPETQPQPIEQPTQAPEVDLPPSDAFIRDPSESFQELPLESVQIAERDKAGYEAEGDPDKFRETIEYDPTKKRKTKAEIKEELKVAVIDKFEPLGRLEQQITGIRSDNVKTSLNAYANMHSGVKGKAVQYVEDNIVPILEDVKKAGYTHKDIGDYASAVHAWDLTMEGIDTGKTEQGILATINKYKDKPALEKARKELVNYSNNLLDMYHESGRITDDVYNAIKNKWENYVPFNRVMDADAFENLKSFNNSFSGSMVAPDQDVKRIKGSSRKTIDPIVNMVNNTFKMMDTMYKTKGGQIFKALAEQDVEGKYIRKLEEFETYNPQKHVRVYEKGEPVDYYTDPAVYKAMSKMQSDSPTTNVIMKALSAPAKLLRAGATLTPTFAARNPARDVMNAMINEGFNPTTDFAKGIASVVKKDQYFKDFNANLGGQGGLVSSDIDYSKKLINKIKRNKFQDKALTYSNPINAMRDLTELTELGTRVGMFRKLVDQGVDPAQAAYLAKDLQNFTRSGTAGQFINKLVPFFNADIQGKSKMIRSIKKNPAAVMARLGVGVVLPTILQKAMHYLVANDEQKKKMDDAPDWLRNTFYQIPLPGTNTILRFPKPFEYAVVSNVVDRFIDYGYGKDKKVFDGFLSTTLEQQLPNYIPQFAVPLIESWANKSIFRDAPIIPQREKDIPYAEQQDVRTSELAKQLASIVQKTGKETNWASPRIWDNAMRSSTGGLGSMGLSLYDEISKKITGDKIQRADKQFKLPVLGDVARGFTVSDMSTGKGVEYVYDTYSKLDRNKDSLNPAQTMEHEFLASVKDELSDISKAMREISNDPDFTGEEKREMLLDLNKQRNDIAINARDMKGSKPEELISEMYDTDDALFTNRALTLHNKGYDMLPDNPSSHTYNKVKYDLDTQDRQSLRDLQQETYNAVMKTDEFKAASSEEQYDMLRKGVYDEDDNLIVQGFNSAKTEALEDMVESTDPTAYYQAQKAKTQAKGEAILGKYAPSTSITKPANKEVIGHQGVKGEDGNNITVSYIDSNEVSVNNVKYKIPDATVRGYNSQIGQDIETIMKSRNYKQMSKTQQAQELNDIYTSNYEQMKHDTVKKQNPGALIKVDNKSNISATEYNTALDIEQQIFDYNQNEKPEDEVNVSATTVSHSPEKFTKDGKIYTLDTSMKAYMDKMIAEGIQNGLNSREYKNAETFPDKMKAIDKYRDKAYNKAKPAIINGTYKTQTKLPSRLPSLGNVSNIAPTTSNRPTLPSL